MFVIKLDDLLEKYARKISFLRKKSVIEHLKTQLDFHGEHNSHLKNPENLNDEPFFVSRKEEDKLSGNESVYGNYLLLWSCEHDDSEILISFDDLKEMEQRILNGGGYTNRYTSNMIAFIKGEIKDFKIYTLNENNEKMYHEKGKNDEFFQDLKHKYIEWSD